MYSEKYNKSWALCIGINNYIHASKLDYAVNDAKEISEILINKFDFSEENTTILIDEDATKDNIHRHYLSYVNKAEIDDRIIFFYAGHGHTIIGNRGEVGYLFPYDGKVEDIFTLLRWDNLTKDSELIPAKHILFILDACFSGISITRALPNGSKRFINDMLLRNGRQVLTAGKANQTVSDSDGPIPKHSIFTGHLLNGLNGGAASTNDLITANGIMAYVYEKVAKDYRSQQTPHYGFFSGDGDFIFNYKGPINPVEKMGLDELYDIPIISNNIIENKYGLLEKVKEYLADPKYRIKLDDLITNELKILIGNLNKDNFPAFERTENNIREGLKCYEQITQNIRTISVSVSYWGDRIQKNIQDKIINILCDHLNNSQKVPAVGKYPIILQMYCIGLPLLAVNDYEGLYQLLNLNVVPYDNNTQSESFLLTYAKAYSDLDYTKILTILKEHERQYVPINEYLFKTLQPMFEDILFLGNSYEQLYDRFEILLGLIHADIWGNKKNGRYWGPLGRYAWKFTGRGFGSINPFSQLKNEALEQKNNWPILKAGFFNSSFERAQKTLEEFEGNLLNLNWF
ncbi:MAG: caspase family protein [Ignavibacteriales bacterium]|nr:MAG: caspase family protein [Ignavibacteriales bacterium]